MHSSVLDKMIAWDRAGGRKKLHSAALSALDLCHHPENSHKYLFWAGIVATGSTEAKYYFRVDLATALPYDELTGIPNFGGYHREHIQAHEVYQLKGQQPFTYRTVVTEFETASQLNLFCSPRLIHMFLISAQHLRDGC